MYPPTTIGQTHRKAQAAGGLADHLAANPLSASVRKDPLRQAMQQRRKQTAKTPQTIENVFGLSAASQQNPLANGARMANDRAAQIQSRMANAATMGQQAASSQGYTDNFGVTTRRGVGFAGPSMGNQSAIDAAYAQRAARAAAKPTARIGKGADGKPMVAQGVTMDKLFPSATDAGNRAKFEAAQSARADRKTEARQMRQDQLAQQRQAVLAQQNQTPVINPFMNPIALEAMRRDPTLALGAVNNLNESLQGRSRLDQIAEQASQSNELANKRFTLDDLVQRAGVDNQSKMTLLNFMNSAHNQSNQSRSLDLRRDELDSRMNQNQKESLRLDRLADETLTQGEFMRSPEYHERKMALTGREMDAKDEPMTSDERLRRSMQTAAQAPEVQYQTIAAAGRAIRENPDQAQSILDSVGASPGTALQAYQEAHYHPNTLLWADEVQEATQNQEIRDLETFLKAAGIDHPELGKRKPGFFDTFWPGGPAPESQTKKRPSDAYDGLSTATVFGMQ